MSEDQQPQLFDIRTHKIKWVLPRTIAEKQDVVLCTQGLNIIPYYDFVGDGNGIHVTFFPGQAKRVFDENLELEAIEVGFFRIEKEFLDNPCILALMDPKDDDQR